MPINTQAAETERPTQGKNEPSMKTLEPYIRSAMNQGSIRQELVKNKHPIESKKREPKEPQPQEGKNYKSLDASNRISSYSSALLFRCFCLSCSRSSAAGAASPCEPFRFGTFYTTLLITKINGETQ
ncbi:hypothetical protein L1887_02543 [Cichorium endivia]|nr:hypothetical protein L1887_02543 [Cichorium endivia]